MLIKIAKALWIGAAVFLLFVTLYGFDGKPNSDIGIILAWYGLFLSFPAGLLVSLMHAVLYDGFSITVETSYLSLVLDWLGFFVLGYLQWFKGDVTEKGTQPFNCEERYLLVFQTGKKPKGS